MANGVYTLPQQLTADIRGADFVYNIGGDAYHSRGIEDENKRLNNFADFAQIAIPSAEGESLITKVFNIKTISQDLLKKILSRASVYDKLNRYLLNPEHELGGQKAKWFEKALGFSKKNMTELAEQIVFDPTKAVETEATQYGIKYNQKILIKGANGKNIEIVTAWIKTYSDNVVKLVTATPATK
jgi:hypothetical protein